MSSILRPCGAWARLGCFTSVLPLLVALLGTACSDDDAPTLDAGGTPEIDAGGPSGDYVPLITAEWTFVPGAEGYYCATRTLTEDLYVGAIRPIAPLGTHHTTVSLGIPNGPDDPGSECGVSFGQFYASGVGTQELILPEGVGLVARAGQQLRLNLHIFNATESDLHAISGVEVKLLEPSQVVHEATVSLNGTTSFAIPPTGTPYTVSHTEALEAGQTLIAIFPHMHQAGSHFKARVLRGDAPITLWDEAYQFESQEFEALPALTIVAGDELETTCTWVNETASSIIWGDSSTAEMCFTILMSY